MREDLFEPAAGQGMSGTARAVVDVVGPTGPPVVVEETPSLDLAGDAAEGDEFRCTLVGRVRGRLPLLESVAALELRQPQQWRSVATLFAATADRAPNWLPAGKGWFGRTNRDSEQVCRLPPDLPTGEYRVAIRYRGGASCRGPRRDWRCCPRRGGVDNGLVWSPAKELSHRRPSRLSISPSSRPNTDPCPVVTERAGGAVLGCSACRSPARHRCRSTR